MTLTHAHPTQTTPSIGPKSSALIVPATIRQPTPALVMSGGCFQLICMFFTFPHAARGALTRPRPRQGWGVALPPPLSPTLGIGELHTRVEKFALTLPRTEYARPARTDFHEIRERQPTLDYSTEPPETGLGRA